MGTILSVGDQSPDFSLPDQLEKTHSLSEFKGKWVVLYFYPRDNTPGCTKEACGFRDLFMDYSEKDIVIIGMSKDSVSSHVKFIEKYKLPFLLLSDETHQVLEKYGAWGPKKFMGREFLGTKRISYIINPIGKIAFLYPKVDPLIHSKEVLEKILELKKVS
jgi:thioredoxin-dependent peroxiredoxin